MCIGLSITVPPAKMGKRSAVFNLIMRQINSETVEDSADQGLDLFTDMDTQLKQILSTRPVKTEATKTTVTSPTTVSTSMVTSGGSGSALGLQNANVNTTNVHGGPSNRGGG